MAVLALLKDPVREWITGPPSGRESLDFRSLQSAFGKPLDAPLFRLISDGVFRSLHCRVSRRSIDAAARRNQFGRRRGVDEEVSEKSLRNGANHGLLVMAKALLTSCVNLLQGCRSEEHTSELQSPMYLVCR